MGRIILLLATLLVLPTTLQAESRYFLGTQRGLERTGEAFLDGRYKEHNLFLITGVRPTHDALHAVGQWHKKTTYGEDLKRGGRIFRDQLGESADSFPENAGSLGESLADLFIDPVDAVRDLSLLTPATLVAKTVINTLRIGWHGVMLVAEPVVRTSAGTLALVGSPLIQPAFYTAKGTAYTGTALYGYTSSAVAATVLGTATGAVLALDVATTPAVAVVSLMAPSTAPDTQHDEVAATP